MRQLTTGAKLAATAAAVAAIGGWTLLPIPGASEHSGHSHGVTSGSIALVPEVVREEVRSEDEGDLIDVAGGADARSASPQDVAARQEAAARRAEAAARQAEATAREAEVARKEAAAREEALARKEAEARKARAAEVEREAVAALRVIDRAQRLLQTSATIDSDGDGTGEYGYLGELMGESPVRKFAPGVGARAGHPGEVLKPSFLPSDFGVFSIVGAHGALKRSGYYFRVFLADASTQAPVGALAEAAGGGTGALFPGPFTELAWGCYAWPVESGELPLRTFFVNHEGTVVACDEVEGGYAGTNVPRFDAALSSAVAGDMLQPLGLESVGHRANDGFVWRVVK